MNVVLSLVNGRTIGSGENKEEHLEDMNPSPMSWHKNCKTTFGIANNNGKGTNISVFDRSATTEERLVEQCGDFRASGMDDVVGRHGTNGTVFTVVVFESVQKKRRRHSCEFMFTIRRTR